MRKLRGPAGALALPAALSACVSFPDAPAPVAPPVLAANAIQVEDGALLGLRSWRAEHPQAVILAIHGMNDYGRAFEDAGRWWAAHGAITTYALDQRGFGVSPGFGRWAGAETLKADLRAALAAIRDRHRNLPVYILGHSMGAAVVLAAAAEAPLNADGLILAAPGVWGGDALPPGYRLAANLAAALAPQKTLTGERAGRQATDNIEILREMAADPLVIKETRVDAILGVVRLMGEAFAAPPDVCADTLVLMGRKDEIIPLPAMEKTVEALCGPVAVRRFPNGWHLLFRDRQRETVFRAVGGWINVRVSEPEKRDAAHPGK